MDKQKQIDELLKQVLTMETQQAFDYLKSATADDDVVNQVALLLNPSDTRTVFLHERGLMDAVIQPVERDDLSGTTIQNIKLIVPLGEGGMGTVYLAEDTTLQRKVAVKALHNSHQISPKVQERFRREALILSQLDHPNICRIYYLIETAQSDYLVLELIKGKTLKNTPLQPLSRARKFDIALALLEALKTAHSKNIIHRDLKPENIMINEDGEVKVLDFGISRLGESPTNPESARNLDMEASNQTVQGTVMGTLTYMSPEQAAGEELTTASDIYTMGLVFQEIFSETPVYEDDLTAEQLLKHSTAAETQTPTDLSNDLTQLIQRMKSKVPAERPTAVDAIQILQKISDKLARRLKYGLVAALLLVAGLGVFKHIKDLNHEREQAQIARDQAEQVTEFLTSIFQVSNPYAQNAKNITALELLKNGAKRIDTELQDQPEVQAFLRTSMGNVYRQLGLTEQAKPLLETAYQQIKTTPDMNPQHKADIITSLGTLAMTDVEYEQAEKYFQEALQVLPDKQSKTYFATQSNLAILYSRTNQYDKARILNLALIELLEQHDPGNVDDLSTAYNSLGMVYFRLEQPDKAVPYFEQGLAVIEQSDVVLNENKIALMANLALVKAELGEHQEALDLSLETLELKEQMLPANHPDLILAYDNLAFAYYQQQNLKQAQFWNGKAISTYEEVFKSNEGISDQIRYDYAMTLANYAVLLRKNGQIQDAKSSFEKVVSMLKELLGNQHHYVADYVYELGKINFLQNKIEESASQVEQALAIYAESNRPFKSRHLKSWLLKAEIIHSKGQKEELLALKKQLLAKLSMVEKVDQDDIDLVNETLEKLLIVSDKP
jgi:tRNA A-37 threonylcarbamoyl transferase component Bud32/uncharacterized protein YukE